ncbi:MAG TPA: TonB-dependent receptor [Candidatus Eremiobacteraceae bacterium]|nr:TonB-dependent receptor [Candidatus Eremiobacteraceae bacterium]
MSIKGLLRLALLALLVVAFQGTWALAGTTGSIQGIVTDSDGHPIAGAAVTAISPSQSAHSVTDSKGFFALLNLSPDTYAVTASKDGYDASTLNGLTVQADQATRGDLSLRSSAKLLGHVTATAPTSVVNKTVTGDLYAVNSQAINSYQGSSGGAETLYSQNGVVGSLPGVVRTVGSGGGYFGQGTLSLRGGAYDQIGFELDGVPLNRGFDFYNSTSFLTNGLASLEVYTGGEPADAGRAMSGYINQVMQRGRYPGGADFTVVAGSPTFNHTLQTDVFGATPNGGFSYYVSTLATNAGYDFNNRQDNNNLTLSVPANDPGCADFAQLQAGDGAQQANWLNCGRANNLLAGISQGTYGSNIYGAQRDTVANLHWLFGHNGLQDDLQALYVTGSTFTPSYDQYSGPGVDPALYCEESACALGPNNQILWPTGSIYRGAVNQPDTGPSETLTWPTANGSQGGIPAGFTDNQITQYSIEKLGFTRSLSSTSYVRLYGYQLYSFWTLNQPTEAIVGGTFYQLHDNATGITLNYQNQLSSTNSISFDADYTKDLTLRYNYGNYFHQQRTAGEPGGGVVCGDLAVFSSLGACGGANTNVAIIRGPYGYWSSTTPITSDAVVADTWKPSDKWSLDIGARYDQFKFALMPLQITGPNGLAEQAQNQWGMCLHGYHYGAGEPCNGYLTGYVAAGTGGLPQDLPGAANWQDVSGDLTFNEFSPRFGATYTLSSNDVLRFSVGRYVQPPNSAFEEYRAAPFWGSGDTISILNRYYDGLGFLAVHNVQPEDSTNYDLSFEHDFSNGLSAKITPFYRDTRGQILNLPVNPQQPSFVTGYNFGVAHISGVEFLARKNRLTENGLSATFSATYTQSKIRFTKSAAGVSFIDLMNNNIKAYNADYGTKYALLDPNGYYYPSYTQSPLATSPSYTVPFVFTLTLDERTHGFDITPTFNYQSGNPYGDPALFPDPHCNPNLAVNPSSCVPVGVGQVYDGGAGPNPYTHTFDAPGSLKGPSWLAMNLSVSHDLGTNSKVSFLVTNLFTSIHNHGYPWELPTGDGVLSYGDNIFYNLIPLGYNGLTGFPDRTQYFGDNYYPYSPSAVASAREYVFSISTKI